MAAKPHDRKYREPENMAVFADNKVFGEGVIWFNSILMCFVSIYFIGLEYY